MNLFKSKSRGNLFFALISLTAFMFVALLVTHAQADLVLDESTQAVSTSPAMEQPAVQQQPTQVLIQSAPTTVGVPVTQTSPAVSPTVNTDALQQPSRSELLRRERVREEIKNEDVLQTRLEELRLRDEKRRTNQVLGIPEDQDLNSLSENQKLNAATPVQEVRVGEAAVAPVAPITPVEVRPVQDKMTVSASAASGESTVYGNDVFDGPEYKTPLFISARGGLANMSSSTGYEFSSRYSMGVGFGVGVSDQLTVELGYLFSEYGVGMASNNPFVQSVQAYQQGAYGYYNNNSFDTLVMKQNVFDAGLKIYLLNSKAVFRPFVGGGAAYSKSYINYSDALKTELRRLGCANCANDYDLSQYLGTLSTGFDIRVSKSVSLGLTFKYYAVLTSQESQRLDNRAFYSGQYGYNPYYSYAGYLYGAAPPSDQQSLAGSIARQSFYSVLGGATFSF